VTAVDSGACSNLGGSLSQAKVLAAATEGAPVHVSVAPAEACDLHTQQTYHKDAPLVYMHQRQIKQQVPATYLMTVRSAPLLQTVLSPAGGTARLRA
jgi:hypothetical protein